MEFQLERFVEVQNKNNPFYGYAISNYDSAIEEIQANNKETHWIWYIFPQIKGLGVSQESNYYGLSGIDEAKEYLNHPVLSERLINCFDILYKIDKDLVSVFREDEKKVWACATLFSLANDNRSLIFDLILEKHFNSKKHFQTIQLINI